MKDLTLPENNDLIPTDGIKMPEADRDNDLIPGNDSILKQLGDNDIVRIGDFIIQRCFKHGEGQTGGEYFRIQSQDSHEIRVELDELADIKTEDGIKSLFEKE